jgi:2,3,4,5-tetrahydropyridine-2-carboxylate N-succinyltransferase
MDKLVNVAFGVGTKNSKGEWLEVFFPKPKLELDLNLAQTIGEEIGWDQNNQAIDLEVSQLTKIKNVITSEKTGSENTDTVINIIEQYKNSVQPLVIVFVTQEKKAETVPEVYLKLHLLSHRYAKPHELDLTDIFGKLPNVAWTNQGAIALDELPQKQLSARLKGEKLTVSSIDKFPPMADYIVPSGVRIAVTARVRLGAYLGEGTTVMHEGFINFNAGTTGPNMVEGRISAGVVIGAGTDLGGGCSTMGTLSGGNQTIISVGKNCLLGANSGLGIPLGDRCTIEAGLYLTAGAKVNVLDNKGEVVDKLKASQLSGESDLLFRRNSQTGIIECLTNRSFIELNTALHQNN